MITRPKGEALSFHRGVWNVIYYVDKIRKMKSLGTDDRDIALIRRDAFFTEAVVKDRKTYAKEDRYVYYRNPWFFKYKGKELAGGKSKKGMIKARDDYFKENPQEA